HIRIFRIYKSDNCFATPNPRYSHLEFILRSKYTLAIEICKTINGKEYVCGSGSDFSVFALPPSPAAGTHLLSDCMHCFQKADLMRKLLQRRKKAIPCFIRSNA
ncbi:MAG: hypothetical protein Q3X77_00750, partial [Oscillospiraceae bacterium]|nr:hypothetical protein [Oscillospiraceae bacterium]